MLGPRATAKHLPCSVLQQLLASIIGIVSLVVHYQLVLNKVEAVRTGLVGIFNHQTNCKSGKEKKCKCAPRARWELSILSKIHTLGLLENVSTLSQNSEVHTEGASF